MIFHLCDEQILSIYETTMGENRGDDGKVDLQATMDSFLEKVMDLPEEEASAVSIALTVGSPDLSEDQMIGFQQFMKATMLNFLVMRLAVNGYAYYKASPEGFFNASIVSGEERERIRETILKNIERVGAPGTLEDDAKQGDS